MEALTLFSKRGYEGVSVKEIAAAVGIKDSSLYKHFPSKRAIFEAIFAEMDLEYAAVIESWGFPMGSLQEVADHFGHGSVEMLLYISHQVFGHFLKDPFAAKFRRMLTIEQYNDAQSSASYQNFFIDTAISFQTELFSQMIASGYFREADPYVVALHFYAPIYLLLNEYDRKPEAEAEALEKLDRHILQFARLYEKETKA